MNDPTPDDLDLTVLLNRSSRGDRDAADAALGLVESHLRRLAKAQMRKERPDHTLQATALVNEAWMRLLPRAPSDFADRSEFFGRAARAMRNVLVDHARARARDKRGGGREREPFEIMLEHWSPTALDADAVLDLHDALNVLARTQSRAARVLELRVFVGLTVAETAAALGIAESTVDVDFRAARAWLAERLAGE